MSPTAALESPAAVKPKKRPVFPFTAIVGQEEMKLALMLNVIDPKIGGVMIMGDRGTGKSTTIRALADLLPEIEVIADDPFNSHPEQRELMSDEAWERVQSNSSDIPVAQKQVPMVDLPLGATEDRVCGTIDIEKALSEGVKAFEPGLLAKANRGILYVDEVNLLDDHLVDVLLDSAASGWNTVEREGISIRHPARFVLVGSGNPEEGELRPPVTRPLWHARGDPHRTPTRPTSSDCGAAYPIRLGSGRVFGRVLHQAGRNPEATAGRSRSSAQHHHLPRFAPQDLRGMCRVGCRRSAG